MRTHWDEWEKTERRYGLYIHKKTGALALAEPPKEEGSFKWTIDKGRIKAHPFFRLKIAMVEEGTGNFFFNKSLNNYEYVEDLEAFKEEPVSEDSSNSN